MAFYDGDGDDVFLFYSGVRGDAEGDPGAAGVQGEGDADVSSFSWLRNDMKIGWSLWWDRGIGHS
jgi:hypothetical protein